MIAAGSARPIWPGRAGDRLFLTMASSGIDAETVAAVNPRLKHHVGRFALGWPILVSLWRYRRRELCVRVAGVDHRGAMVIAAKGPFYAGSWVIAPQADLSEPMLDLVLLQRSGRLAVLRYLGALVLGRLPQRTDITILRCREVFVSAAETIPVQADGEIVGRLPILIGIAERPLQLVQP